jgi:hypothetical protein
LGSRRGRETGSPLPRQVAALISAAALSIRRLRGLPVSLLAATLLAIPGCGDEGVTQGATASVYVVAPLCSEASKELNRNGPRAGDVRLRVKCLPKAGDLTAIGAGARRATEDSTTIAYVGTRDPTAIRFSETILEEAGIAQLSTSSGAAAMDQIIHAVDEAGDTSNLRESVRDGL